MTALQRKTPAGGPGSGMSAGGQTFHVQSATAEPLLQRLERVQKSGNGWRALCPACGGRSQKLAITESEGRVLVHCFAGCRAIEVLESVGLRWADIMPPRYTPTTPQERRRERQAMREAAAVVAIDALAVEATVILLASRQVARWQVLSVEDDERLMLACDRIEKASHALSRKEQWRPNAAYSEPGLVSAKRGVVNELRRQMDVAEQELASAEAALAELKKHKEADA